MAAFSLIEVGDGTLDALAGRPEVVEALPGLDLAGLAAARLAHARACGRCGNTKDAARARLKEAYARTRQAIVALAPDGLRRLKGFLDADSVRVTVGANHQGLPVRHTL